MEKERPRGPEGYTRGVGMLGAGMLVLGVLLVITALLTYPPAAGLGAALAGMGLGFVLCALMEGER